MSNLKSKGLFSYLGLFVLVISILFGVTYFAIHILNVDYKSETIVYFKLGETDQLQQGENADKITNFVFKHDFTSIGSTKRKKSDEFIIRFGKSSDEDSALNYADVVKRKDRYLFFFDGFDTSSIELNKSEMKEFKRLMCVGINDCYF